MTHGYSSRFANSQPVDTRPKTDQRNEIALQTEEYIARGGCIEQVFSQQHNPYRPSVVSFSHELAMASGLKGSKKSAQSRRGNRGNWRPQE